MNKLKNVKSVENGDSKNINRLLPGDFNRISLKLRPFYEEMDFIILIMANHYREALLLNG